MRNILGVAGFLGGCAILAACSAGGGTGESGSGAGGGTGNGAGGGTGTSMGAGMNSGAGGEINITVGVGGSTGAGTGTSCVSGPDEDKDQDGFSVNQGDCNDCDANVNPGALEVVAVPDMNGNTPDPADEDCDGQVDNVAATCDSTIAFNDLDPMNGARAIDLCQFTTPSERKWGVLEAKYVRANGAAATPSAQVGILNKFGSNVNVQAGSRMLVLSSGRARMPGQEGACTSQTCTSWSGVAPPSGFPQDVPNCAGSSNINDDIALEVKLRSPTNATGYSFNFKFYSYEYAEYVCTAYNDQFIALVTPPPMGSINGNISFDSKTNPVSVNIAFFSVCDPSLVGTFAQWCNFGCPSPPNPYCPSGTAQLQGTGFDTLGDSGATDWLKTQAPIKGGDEVTIRYTIWDTGDSALDSTALVDNFQWIASGGTVVIGTDPIPIPK